MRWSSSTRWRSLALVASLVGACGGPGDSGRDGSVPPVDSGGAGIDGGIEERDAGSDGGPEEPPPPVFPDTIGHLSFAVLTGSGPNDGTDANTLSLCLNETRCFRMNVADVNDFRRGEMDVYHFDGVDLPRSEVDRVELRSTSGTDAWRPTCIEVRFDGEPVHCRDGLTSFFGNGAATELEVWRDPEGLHEACETCYPTRLTHGPVMGATSPDTARVLVRTEATRRTRVRLVNEATPMDAHARVAYPSPLDDYTSVFMFEGLSPSTRYAVEVEVEGAVLGTGRTTTAPPDGEAGAFQVAFGSCTRQDAQPIFATVEALRPDLFLFVGDNHYANSPDLESLWWFYRWGLEVPERASLLRSTPTMAIWDDHDYVGNNTNGASPGKESALRAFGDYWANPAIGLPEEPGVYFHATHGDVDFFMLDNRYERGPEGGAGATILGEAQAAWLERELEASTATFRVIGSGTIWSETGGESWAHYPASRDRLFDFIRDRGIGGVILIAGDVHRSQLRRVHHAGTYDIPEVVSSPMANSNSNCPASVEPDAAQIACADGGNYFAVFDIDTTLPDPRVVARLYDQAGAVVASMPILRSELE